MAQRVTTKIAIPRADVNNARNGSTGNIILNTEVDDYRISRGSQKTFKINKQKMLDTKYATLSKTKSGEKLLAQQSQKTKEDKIIDINSDKPNHTSAMPKPAFKKIKTNRRRKIIKPTQIKKLENYTKKNENIIKKEKSQVSHNTQLKSQCKILRPCANTLRGRKCLSEISCPYLHSEFPCKYYYLNLLCPQGIKCQFMHNGPLDPKLVEALKNHILELLSTNPSAVEIHFVKQMHNIEDLSQRLQTFQININDDVIKVKNGGDEDRVISSNAASINVYNNKNDNAPTANLLSNISHETDTMQILETSSEKLNTIYEKFKETNLKIDRIDKKLQNIKTSSDLTPNEKIHQLQSIYDQLKEQEKLIPRYESLNMAKTREEISTSCDITNHASSTQTHAVLINPDIVKDIQTLDFEKNLIEENMPNRSKNLQAIGSHENVHVQEAQQLNSIYNNILLDDIFDGSKINDFIMLTNMDYEEEPTTNTETIANNCSVNAAEINGNKQKDIEEMLLGSNTCNLLHNENQKIEWFTFETTGTSVDKMSSKIFDKNENIDENATFYNNLNLNIQTNVIDKNNENDSIQNNNEDVEKNECIDGESLSYKDIANGKKRCRIRVRSHSSQVNKEAVNCIDGEQSTDTTVKSTNSIRNRRCRLPKPSQKVVAKFPSDECQIDVDDIIKLINNNETPRKENAKAFSTPNVILSNRFLKRNKIKLEKESLPHETKANGDDSYSLSRSPCSLKMKTNCDNKDLNDDIDLSNEKLDEIKQNIEKCELLNTQNSKEQQISFENCTLSHSTSPFITIKEQFNLGNPYVLLHKIKNPFVVTSSNDLQADTITSQSNTIVTSSILLTDTKTIQKRRHSSCNSESDSDSFFKENKCLKIDDSESITEVKIDKHLKNDTQQSNNSTDGETTQRDNEINYSLLNKLSTYSTSIQINFEKPSKNITTISSPTYIENTISSPSPIKKSIDVLACNEIDGRLTYPPMPYIVHEIDLGKIEINKPMSIDKLRKTIQLDPRVFKKHVKKPVLNFRKSVEKTSNALVPITISDTPNLSHDSLSVVKATSFMISQFDPRNRTDKPTSFLSHQTALTSHNSSLSMAALSSASTSLIQTGIQNSVPLALQYQSRSQSCVQSPIQQTPNMFLYGSLQRSSWYQSLMHTMRMQINQSISQLIRALTDYHRERLFNPDMVFDIFKIDCAGELLEIMRNLGIFVDANGIINQQRNVPSSGGSACCNAAMPVNATYSFIQQVLKPNTNCTSLTTSSSTYNAGNSASVGQLNVNEPFLSCYIKAPEPVQKHSDVNNATYGTHFDDDNNNNDNRHCCHNRNENNSNNYSYENKNRRYTNSNQFKKPYDNNNSHNNNYRTNINNYHPERSTQRHNSSYSSNPRFRKPGASSPPKSSYSPPRSPRKGFNSSGKYGSCGGSRARGGRFNNNGHFNNYNNGDRNKRTARNSSSWSSYSSDSNKSRYNNKYKDNNSPPHKSSLSNKFHLSGSKHGRVAKAASPPTSKNNSSDEECWD